MKEFKSICRNITLALALLATTAGCTKRAEIPDGVLVNIFHDAFLANAYLDVKSVDTDSLIIYEPILEKYGYTIDDLRSTMRTFSERKSARLSDLIAAASKRLEDETKSEAVKLTVLDTIDNIAKREFTRTVYSDSLIRVTRLADTTKLQITIKDLIPGEYNVSFTYLVDTLDENRNSRVEAYLLTSDSIKLMRHTLMLSRHREGKYSRKFSTDTAHKSLYLNLFYHPANEEAKRPDIKITDLRVVRTLRKTDAAESLFVKQVDIRIFDHNIMTKFTDDTITVATPEVRRKVDSLVEIAKYAILPDSTLRKLVDRPIKRDTTSYEPQDSLTLHAS